MKTVSSLLSQIASWKTLLFFFALDMSFNLYFLKNAESRINALSGNENGVIDLTFGIKPQKTLDLVAAYSPEARSFYAHTELTTDIIYPIVYAFFFGIVLTLLFRNKSYSPFSTVNVLPFVSLIFDYLENFSIVALLKSYPTQSHTLAWICEIVKMIKWLSIGVAMVFILYGLARWIIARFYVAK